MEREGEAVRHGMTTWEKWGAEALPWAFAVSGLALGAGAVALERPISGLCGAIAGVTAGLIERHRANSAERVVSALRIRLRDQREKAEENAAGLRKQVRELQSELWQRDLDRVSAGAVAALAAGAAPAAAAAEVAPAEVAAGEVAAEETPVVSAEVVAGEVAVEETPVAAEEVVAEEAAEVVTGPPSGPIARVIDLRGTPAAGAQPDPETGEIPAAAAG